MASSRVTVGLAAVAAALAGIALQVRANARRAEREHPPAGRFIHAGGIRLHYLEAGMGGPPVVLLHGNAVQAEDYVASGVFGLVAERHRVLAFDRPGYGYSERPRDRPWTAEAQAAVLAEALARLGIRRAIVVGHSWGTLTALALALNHPEAVGGLVLLSGYYFPTARADVAMISPTALPVLGDAIRYTVGPLVGRLMAPMMVRTMFAPAPVPAAFTSAVPTGMMLRPWQIKASAEDAAAMIPAAAALVERYGELSRLPVSIMAGAEDMIVDRDRQSARLHREIAASSLQVVSGLGHMVHHGAPDLVVQAIEAIAAPGQPVSAAMTTSAVAAEEHTTDIG
ncbi:alpha/beta hydrolase [Pseudoroseomonas wenyumeiae]|uniref:Alpha/beta hydrolase n=3 Tax=Teichococcus wenyumeiae TaxID=2478470 RepID=A0ABX9VB35_9PROT|nr:alpha/beta hydrolase [Pseudoroseomonas wenyumeiae]RMI14553.1 alpha/beta hydrolase [Pseudoroseomonas wenyumeiae]